MAAEAQTTALAAGQQLDRDVQASGLQRSLRDLNDRVVPILQEVSGLDLGPKKQEWQNWYIDQIGYQSKPVRTSQPATVVEEVPLDYQPQARFPSSRF